MTLIYILVLTIASIILLLYLQISHYNTQNNKDNKNKSENYSNYSTYVSEDDHYIHTHSHHDKQLLHFPNYVTFNKPSLLTNDHIKRRIIDKICKIKS